MFRFINVAQRVVGSKCTAPAKSASASYADVASAVHPHECASSGDDLEYYQSRFERWAELRQQHYAWRWGIDVSNRHVAIMRARRRWREGCRGNKGQERSQEGAEEQWRGCEQEWHDKWKTCRHDMWSSCHRTWHFLEAVGWGTAAVIGYQISGQHQKDERRREHLEEHRCILKRLCSTISSLLQHPWAICQAPSRHNSSILSSHMLPRIQNHTIPLVTGGERNSAECVTSETVAETSESKTGGRKSFSWHVFTEQAAFINFDKLNLTSSRVTEDAVVMQPASVEATSSAGGSNNMPPVPIDTLMAEIVDDWQRLARDYCASLDNAAAVKKANRGCLEEAVAEWKQIVEETDNSKALFNLALSFEQGLGTARDINKAVEYYERAADKGNPKAAFNLAMIILRENFESRLDEVRYLLKLAASQGLPEAQRELACLYAEDNPADMVEAVSLFQQAAEKNDVHSCYNLALCYEQGLGVEMDERRAVELYERAAAHGHPDALISLAAYYETGRAGVVEDKHRALELYQSAQAAGYREAKACVARIEQLLSHTFSKSSSTSDDGMDSLQLPGDMYKTMTRSASSSVTFSRLLSTGSDASDLSSSSNDNTSTVYDDDDEWGSDTQEATTPVANPKRQSSMSADRDRGLMMFSKKSSLRTGFFVGFSDEEDEEGMGSEVETF